MSSSSWFLFLVSSIFKRKSVILDCKLSRCWRGIMDSDMMGTQGIACLVLESRRSNMLRNENELSTDPVNKCWLSKEMQMRVTPSE